MYNLFLKTINLIIMNKLKLTAGILIMLLISSTMVFSQTGKSTTSPNAKTVKTASVKTDQTVVDKNKSGSCEKHQNGQMQGKNFVDKNNDGICDNCGMKKADCKEGACKDKQASGKGAGCCPKGEKAGCSHACGSHKK
jgi:hypothetical protein